MPQLDRNRTIWLYLPTDYHSTTKSYPVLYMHDGQNLFDHATSFVGEWEIDETLDSLAKLGYEVPIVVGINNGQQRRIDELTPWPNDKYGGGDGEAYLKFLTETLKPKIDSAYRTKPQARHTGIMGSSLGGLISFYGGLAYNHVFGIIGAFSPSFWFSDQVYNFIATNASSLATDTRLLLLGSQIEDKNMAPDLHRVNNSIEADLSPDNELTILNYRIRLLNFWKRAKNEI
jgi:predicted alpha/beta superfamily hydrolase